MITIQLIGDRELVAKLDAMPGRVHDGLARTITKLGFELQRKVQGEKLTGQVLKVRSGSLRSSIHPSPLTDNGNKISITVGTNIKYARIHEEGGQTPPHTILPKKARALAFSVGGQTIFARRVEHPGSKIPERSFLRSALAEMVPTIEEGLRKAVDQAIR